MIILFLPISLPLPLFFKEKDNPSPMRLCVLFVMLTAFFFLKIKYASRLVQICAGSIKKSFVVFVWRSHCEPYWGDTRWSPSHREPGGNPASVQRVVANLPECAIRLVVWTTTTATTATKYRVKSPIRSSPPLNTASELLLSNSDVVQRFRGTRLFFHFLNSWKRVNLSDFFRIIRIHRTNWAMGP